MLDTPFTPRGLTVLALCSLFACTSGSPTSAVRSAISDCYDEGDPSCLEELECEDPEDVFDACFAEHAECLGSDGGELCDELLDACFEIYDETDDVGDAISACYDAGEACTRELGIEADECLEMVGECLDSLDEHADPGEEDDVSEICFDEHYDCIEDGTDEACDALLDECLETACPPEELDDPCLEVIEHCFESAPDGEAAEACGEMVDGCFDEPPTDPCEDDFFVCLDELDDGMGDPSACEELLWACDEPDFDCESEYGSCLESGEEEWACEEILWCCEHEEDPGDPCLDEYEECVFYGEDPELCEDVLWICEPEEPEEPEEPPCRSDFDACLEGGIDPTHCEEILHECDPGTPAEPGCWDDFDACLEGGIDPTYCEEILDECDPGTPADPCFEEYEACFEAPGAGDDGECEELLCLCEGWPVDGEPGDPDPGDPGEPPHEPGMD